jgi:hypothetical protein
MKVQRGTSSAARRSCADMRWRYAVTSCQCKEAYAEKIPPCSTTGVRRTGRLDLATGEQCRQEMDDVLSLPFGRLDHSHDCDHATSAGVCAVAKRHLPQDHQTMRCLFRKIDRRRHARMVQKRQSLLHVAEDMRWSSSKPAWIAYGRSTFLDALCH